MPKRRNKRGRKRKSREEPATSLEGGPPTGLPAKDSVREIITFVSPHKKRYQILRTTETDAYDRPMRREVRKRR